MAEVNDNRHEATISSFGHEWSTFTQSDLGPEEVNRLFNCYFGIFPWSSLPPDAEGFDMGCGTGRWAKLVAPRVGRLYCVDAAGAALDVARRNLVGLPNVVFHHATTETAPLPAASCDFGYSLGVLHHIPDTARAMADCVRLLKPGAPFLVYLYYRFDNRPLWFRMIWSCSNFVRRVISRLPPWAKNVATDAIALVVYWPMSRTWKLLERLGLNVAGMPLSFYRHSSVQSLRTDSRDRLGTPLEHRFTRSEIDAMMTTAGLENIRFSTGEPYWCAVGIKRAST
jgi:SAM-dependent methyltransferase